MLRCCGCFGIGVVAGVVVFAVAAYVALMCFDCPILIDDF